MKLKIKDMEYLKMSKIDNLFYRIRGNGYVEICGEDIFFVENSDYEVGRITKPQLITREEFEKMRRDLLDRVEGKNLF